MSLLDIQRRIREAGRIRIGAQVPTGNGTRPTKLEHFRLTSPDRRAIEAAAELYGGEVAEWVAPAGRQWEVFTATDELNVIVPPTDMAFSAWYELWSAGGCQRRCDSVTEQISDGPCVCDPDARECAPHTRLSVMLRDLAGLGVWRLDTQGWYAAQELSGAVAVVQAAAGAGVMLPARLRLEQRVVKRPGVGTRRFAVPVLDVEVTPAQLLGGTGAGGGVVAALPAATPSLTPVPSELPTGPSRTIAEQSAPPVKRPPRKGSAPELPVSGRSRQSRGTPAMERGRSGLPRMVEDADLPPLPDEPPPPAPTRQQDGGGVTPTGDRPGMITRSQSKRLFAMLRAQGVTERQDCLDFVNGLLGADIQSSTELTKGQASQVLDRLVQMEQATEDPEPGFDDEPHADEFVQLPYKDD